MDPAIAPILARQAPPTPLDGAAVVRILRRDALAIHRLGVARLWLYGSVPRGDATPASDVDLLADLESGRRFSLIDLSMLRLALDDLSGRETQVFCLADSRPAVLARILDDLIAVRLRPLGGCVASARERGRGRGGPAAPPSEVSLRRSPGGDACPGRPTGVRAAVGLVGQPCPTRPAPGYRSPNGRAASRYPMAPLQLSRRTGKGLVATWAGHVFDLGTRGVRLG